jgi:hypothetical protein
MEWLGRALASAIFLIDDGLTAFDFRFDSELQQRPRRQLLELDGSLGTVPGHPDPLVFATLAAHAAVHVRRVGAVPKLVPAASARMSLRLSAIWRSSSIDSSRLRRWAVYRIAVPWRAL